MKIVKLLPEPIDPDEQPKTLRERMMVDYPRPMMCHCQSRITADRVGRRFDYELGEWFAACNRCRGFLREEQIRELNEGR
jgi:hypothetical protein